MKWAIGYAAALVAIVSFAALRVRAGHTGAPSTTSSSESAGAGENALVIAPARAPQSEPRAPTGWVGILLAKHAVDVSPRLGSLVRTVSVRPGDTVKRGTTLATLEARDKAQAVRAAAIAQQRQAAHAARSVRLRDATLITADEAEAAKYDEEQRAAELDLVRVLVDDAIIRAPFDGVIVARFVEPGTHVAAGTPMLRMIDPQGARIRFGVPPEVANTIATGQAVRFSTPSIPCKAFGSACPGSHEAAAQSARITSVSPEIDRSAGLVVVEADVGEISAFRSGTQVTVFLAEEAATSARGLLSP